MEGAWAKMDSLAAGIEERGELRGEKRGIQIGFRQGEKCGEERGEKRVVSFFIGMQK